jgi:hypothetical protein
LVLSVNVLSVKVLAVRAIKVPRYFSCRFPVSLFKRNSIVCVSLSAFVWYGHCVPLLGAMCSKFANLTSPKHSLVTVTQSIIKISARRGACAEAQRRHHDLCHSERPVRHPANISACSRGMTLACASYGSDDMCTNTARGRLEGEETHTLRIQNCYRRSVFDTCAWCLSVVLLARLLEALP